MSLGNLEFTLTYWIATKGTSASERSPRTTRGKRMRDKLASVQNATNTLNSLIWKRTISRPGVRVGRPMRQTAKCCVRMTIEENQETRTPGNVGCPLLNSSFIQHLWTIEQIYVS